MPGIGPTPRDTGHEAGHLNVSRTRLFFVVTLCGYFGIMVLLLLWYGWLAPPQLISAPFALLLLGLPLFAPLRGLLHARRYTVAWSLFLSLLYLTHGIVEAWSNPAALWPALAEVVLALCWLGGGIMFIRASSPNAGAAVTDPAPPSQTER